MEECEKRISIRIPCILYDRLIDVKKKRGYATLSELIRDIIREIILEETKVSA